MLTTGSTPARHPIPQNIKPPKMALKAHTIAVIRFKIAEINEKVLSKLICSVVFIYNNYVKGGRKKDFVLIFILRLLVRDVSWW